MVLLLLIYAVVKNPHIKPFTFQYGVTITVLLSLKYLILCYLHSNMVLLLHYWKLYQFKYGNIFTFQYGVTITGVPVNPTILLK